ncbi:MAG: hypothetical protein KJ065_26905 [Anaerolineae bacterium]|nr:hypothetical protein [Anaerolineae bacterium]
MSELSMQDVLASMLELTDDDLIECREAAKELVLRDIGGQPSREDFARYVVQRVPKPIMLLIGGVLGGALVAAFLMSLFRVFTAGRDLFLGHISDQIQAAIAGVATFMLAELLVVGSVLAMTIYFTGWKRLLMLLTALIGVLVALTGNVIISQPSTWWGWLDAVAPPVSVLLISLGFEAMLVSSLRERQRIELEYKKAVDAWTEKTAKPEQQLIFHNRYYPNAIKERLKLINSKGTGATKRKEIMAALRPEHWNVLVAREMQKSDWFDLERGAAVLIAKPQESTPARLNGHGSDPSPLSSTPAEMTALASEN